MGVAFLIFGYPLVKSVRMSTGWNVATFVSIGWLLINWFPHDSLHAHNGQELNGLLAIEYGFHVTLMAAGVVVALFFIRTAAEVAKQRSTSVTRVSTAAQLEAV
jgi:hypothetical protein